MAKGYFPKGIKKIYLGMPYQDFMNAKEGVDFGKDDSFDFRTVLTEDISGKPYETLIYYLDKDGDQPLYEILIVYPAGQNVNEIAEELYGAPNKEKEWYFEHNNGYPVKIWVYKQKLVITAEIPNTEWADEK
jgi:hypothetical protein